MAMRVSTSQSRDDPYHHPWLNPDAPGHMASMRLAASCGVETHRLQRPSIRAGSQRPSPDSLCVFRRRAGRPRGGDPIYTTACFAGPEFARVASTSTQTEA